MQLLMNSKIGKIEASTLLDPHLGALNLQGLIGLFHLNEGSGTDAKNNAPVDTPIDGVITDGSWEDGPITKMLTFNGSSSMVSLGDASKAGINFTGKLVLEVGLVLQLLIQLKEMCVIKVVNLVCIITQTQE